jgi:hypothetical protein
MFSRKNSWLFLNNNNKFSKRSPKGYNLLITLEVQVKDNEEIKMQAPLLVSNDLPAYSSKTSLHKDKPIIKCKLLTSNK